MLSEEKRTQLSDFPKREPGKPGIFVERVGTYPCFCINDLYLGLFAGAKTKAVGAAADFPLICFPGNPHPLKKDKELLEFLLPSLLFQRIEKAAKGDKEYVKHYDYREFFLKSTNNNKITRLLFSLFSTSERDSEKRFIQSIQAHFIQTLKAAEFQQPQLKEFLCALVDNRIAPASVSLTANRAFHSLVDSEEHDAISIAIANVFISAMLGLYSMKYSTSPEKSLGYERKRGYVFVRTYLLNKLGMEFIWTPETISSSYVKLQDALYSYECGLYEEAYRRTLSWLAESGGAAADEELASAYHVLGACLYLYPERCDCGNLSAAHRKKLLRHLPVERLGEDNAAVISKETQKMMCANGISYLEQAVSLDETRAEAFFILYDYYKSQEEEQRAFDCLKTAFAQTFVKAVIEVANRYVKTHKPLEGVDADVILEKLTEIISSTRNYTETDRSECLYLRGRLFSNLAGCESNAETDFEMAAKLGHERARQEISRKERMERQRFPSFSDNPRAPCCFVNSMSGNNMVFVSTIPDGEWSLCTSERQDLSELKADPVTDLDEFIRKQHLGGCAFQRPKIVFLFMSTDEERNLNECLMLLDKLFNIALTIPDERRNTLIDSIDIYVGARYEMASMLLDANINDMGNNIYFKVHIADETRDSVHQLLCDAPLFLPFLDRAKHDGSVHAVLFGCTETNYRIIKESIGCAYLGKEYPVNITMLGTGADRMERRLRQECPGLFHEPRIECIRPTFISCCIKEEDFPNLIYGNKYEHDTHGEMAKALRMGNYFVVDLLSDQDSIRFAMELRTWLLRSGGAFDRAPFIGVRCKNAQNSYLAAHLTLSGQAAGDTYYSRYDLFPFGGAKALYSFERLIENPRLEEVALQIHKSYYGGDDRQAENDYYSFSYNADSSRATAIGLSYRLFAGGAFFPQKESYLNYGIFETPGLLPDYAQAIQGKEDDAASLEQSRWNGFMLSRGWESANLNQVRVYKEQSTGASHKHMLAKLHPFIREWGDLDSDDLMKILGMLQSKFDYNKHPKVTTRKSIEDTPRFFERPIREGKKTR